jgi:hypothetical protein
MHTAGMIAVTTSGKPPPQVQGGLKTHGYTCKPVAIVQPISCITSKSWQRLPTECIETVELLAYYGSEVSCNEPNGFEEKHRQRKVEQGAFEMVYFSNPHPNRLTPIRRASEGRSLEGITCLLNLGAKMEENLYKGPERPIETPNHSMRGSDPKPAENHKLDPNCQFIASRTSTA